MGGLGPITNTRTLKGALVETIDQLERARQKPVVVKLLQRCRDYRELVDDWDSVSPPPDEQFETIGEIMQLLGAAMQATNRKPKHDTDPDIETAPLEPLGAAFDDFDDDEEDDAVVEHPVLKLDLVPASPCATVLDLSRQPWRASSPGIRVKTISETGSGRHHALLRLEVGAELPGQRHDHAENLFVLDGCIRHAGATVHAGACLRIDAGSKSGTITALGETTLLIMDSDRRAIKF